MFDPDVALVSPYMSHRSVTVKMCFPCLNLLLCRVKEVISEFRARLPETDVLLLGILPRDAHVLSGPPAYEWPNRMTKAIDAMNLDFQVTAEDPTFDF